MTWLGLAPMVKPNGWLRFQDESNWYPLRQIAPVYWTTTVSPAATVGPVPLIRTFVVRLAGGFPLGILIVRAAPEAPAVTLMPACALPLVPKPSLGGMTASTRLPIFCPISAVSRPGSSVPANSVGLPPVLNVLCSSLCEVPLHR